MRFKNDKIAALCGAAGLCGLFLTGCGPKDQPNADVASAPTPANDTSLNASATTAPATTPPKANEKPSTPAQPAGAPKKLIPIPKNATKLIVEDIKIGSGKRAEPGTNLSMLYTGTLTNGTVFDSNVKSGEPFTFMLGAGQVIKGWDNGLVGMKVGGKRRLIIPPDMGYGDQAAPGGKIPGGSTLVFTVELKDVR